MLRELHTPQSPEKCHQTAADDPRCLLHKKEPVPFKICHETVDKTRLSTRRECRQDETVTQLTRRSAHLTQTIVAHAGALENRVFTLKINERGRKPPPVCCAFILKVERHRAISPSVNNAQDKQEAENRRIPGGGAHSLFDFTGDVPHDAGLDEGLEDFLRAVHAVVVVHRDLVDTCGVVIPTAVECKRHGVG